MDLCHVTCTIFLQSRATLRSEDFLFGFDFAGRI